MTPDDALLLIAIVCNVGVIAHVGDVRALALCSLLCVLAVLIGVSL